MSRVAKAPVAIPAGVEISLNGQEITVKGAKGSLTAVVNSSVVLTIADEKVSFGPVEGVNVNNMVKGVAEGFTKTLQLNGVGYRANVKGSDVNLTLGFSHPVVYNLPEGITAVCPSQTEIVITGADKQSVGQVAANIRAFRPPEPYKGKGVRYSDEVVRRKEAKKK
ncbi:50S ribosomal protein L6 [Moritella viscosa]